MKATIPKQTMVQTMMISALFLCAAGAVVRAVPGVRVLGPEISRDYYRIGNQRLKLKALLVDTTDLREIARAAELQRRGGGTHDWNWKIGYITLPAHESLVLTWTNLDSGAHAWIAVTQDGSGNWKKASSRRGDWIRYDDKHIIRKDTTNGRDLISRISKTGTDTVAFAFSKSL